MDKKFVTLQDIADRLKLTNKTPDINLSSIKIYHRGVNRPQMFLTGYEGHFDVERIQLLGELESFYMEQMSEKDRMERLDRLAGTGIPAVIVCRGMEPVPELLRAADKYKMPVLVAQQDTAGVMVELIDWLSEQLAPSVTMHGVLVDVYGEGILITGVSGVGKSETAVELVKRGHRLVADDLVEVSRVSETLLIGEAPAMTRHFVELRGIGIVDVKSLYGVESVKDRTPIDMIINLEEWDNSKVYDRLGLEEGFENVLGIEVVKHTVPIRTGRNLAIIIETAAVNNRQKKMGYNAAHELVDRVTEMSHIKKKD